jgi:hypothetical protein
VRIKLALILSVVHELKLFENRVLRKIPGSKTKEVAGDYRKLHTDKLMICIPHQYYYGYQTKEDKMDGTRGMHGESETPSQIGYTINSI